MGAEEARRRLHADHLSNARYLYDDDGIVIRVIIKIVFC
jgi:hypothetical protein